MDAGQVSPAIAVRIREEASTTDLIIMRTRAGAERMRRWGVTAPIEVTADTAFLFRPDPADADLLSRELPGSGVVGIAVVDFYLFPVVARPWGRRSRCYKWPFYFAWSRARREKAADLARTSPTWPTGRWRTRRHVALICMESVDDAMAREVRSRMRHGDRARIFSATEYNTSQITSVLRSLDLLITSRYHAGALSLGGHVPQVAIAHDVRLADLYEETGRKDEYFFQRETKDLFARVRQQADRLLRDPAEVRERPGEGPPGALGKGGTHEALVSELLRSRGWKVGS